jgi:hypothetical protein
MRIVWGLLGIAVLLLGGLLLHPETAPYLRWKVDALFRSKMPTFPSLSDLALATESRSESEQKAYAERIKALRQRFPDSFPIQWAAALFLSEQSADRRREELALLQNDFPNRPEIYASLIRYETIHFRLGRPEEFRFQSSPYSPYPQPAPKREVALRMLEWARKGEQLDDENGFFGGIRALALLALKRDAEAIEVLKAAARKPKWDDYLDEEAEAQTEFARLFTGIRSADRDIAITMGTVSPHLAALRAMARTMVALAAQREERGQVQQGIEIRRAVAEYGTRMRDNATGVITMLVGIACAEMVQEAPGGKKLTLPSPLASEARREIRVDHFLRYLKARGFEQDAAWFEAEFKRNWELKEQARKGMDRFFDGDFYPKIERYYLRLFAFFSVMGLLACWSLAWLASGLASRWRLSFARSVVLVLVAMAVGTLWFTLSSAAEGMWRALVSVQVPEAGFYSTETPILRLANLLRWGLPLLVFPASAVLLALGLLCVALRRQSEAVQRVRTLWQFATLFEVVILFVLIGLMTAQIPEERQLEQMAAQLRKGEVQLVFKVARANIPSPQQVR